MLASVGWAGINGLILIATIVTISAVIAVERRSRQATSPPAEGLRTAADRPDARRSPGMALPSVARQRELVEWLTRSAGLSGALLVGGLLLTYAGQSLILNVDPSPLAYALWLVGLMTIVLLAGVVELQGISWGSTHAAVQSGEWRWSWTKIGLALFLAVASVVLWTRTPDRAADDAVPGLTALWLLSIGALVLLATGLPHRADLGRAMDWVRERRADLMLAGIVLLVAAIPRLVELSSYPWALSGDEGTFAVTARNASEGAITNPFNSGPWGYPSLLFILQGIPIDLFGNSIAAARTLSAVLGIGSVLAVYLLGRHHFGLATGIMAAILTSAFNFHLFWSRDAQNAAAPMFFIPLTLLFLDRGLVGRRRIDALMAGLVIGFGQFFHPADRILFPTALAYAGYALLSPLPRDWSGLRRQARDLIAPAVWVALGAVVAHLPLMSYFWNHREAFWSRTNEVSVFASGWLTRERDITGEGSFAILLRQFINAALLPFNTMPHGHYRPEPPFVGWPLAVPLAIGLAMTSVFFWKRRYFGFALAYWATVAGLALTDGPPQTNRYTAAAPFLAMFAALGLALVARVMIDLVRVRKSTVIALATTLTLLISGWHLHNYFRDPNQVAVYSDTNTQVTNTLARQAAAFGEDLTVYFGGPPRIYYYGFQNLPYIAPNATGIDLDPLTPDMAPPTLVEPTLFVFLPERGAELDVAMSWFPNGELAEQSMDDGTPLYTSYLVLPELEPSGTDEGN